MATGRTIDSKIVARGSNVQRIVAGGNEIYRVVAEGVIRYDRKDYTLSAATGYYYSAPVTGGTVTLPATAITSIYSGYDDSGTRVNGASAGYAISPASISSNAHNTTARDGYLTIMQDNSGLQLTNIRYVQSADSCEDIKVPTGLTVTISNVPVIPASGGSVNSASVSVTANGYVRHDWASGDSTTGSTTSWTVSEYTLAWTGVTAQSKGETTSQQTSAGTLVCQATYEGVTGTGSTTVYQQANQVEGYTDYEYEMAVNTNVTGTYPSSGGIIGVEYSGQRKRKPIYTSTATGSTYQYSDIACDLTSNYGTIAAPSVTGTGSTNLILGANTTANRTVTITLAYKQDNTKKATTSFVQTYSTSVYSYSYLSNYVSSTVLGSNWDSVHNISQGITNWTSPSQSVYAVTENGTTYYRTGSDTTYPLIAVGTYFYNNDSYTFHTRDISTAGASGTEHLWYKNPSFSFTVPSSIPASAATFTMSGSTANTKYYVTVTEGSTPVMNKTLYTGGTMTVNCGQNASTANTRVFTVSFEDYYNAENADMASKTVTQAKKPAPSISIDTNTWNWYEGDLNTITVNITTVGGGWTASYGSGYFSVSPASGSEGTTSVVVTGLTRGATGTYKDINFTHSDLTVGRVRLRVNYL